MRAVDSVREFARAHGASEKTIFGLAVAVEECASNIVNHALQRDPKEKFHVSIEQNGDAFVIELRDRGPEFDPTVARKREPQVDDEEQIGSWGIELARRYTDEILYARRNGENVLRLSKRLREAREQIN